MKIWEMCPNSLSGKSSQTEPMPVDNASADNNTLENTITLTFSKEGEQEQKQATLARLILKTDGEENFL